MSDLSIDALAGLLSDCEPCRGLGYMDHQFAPPKPAERGCGSFDTLPCFSCQGSGVYAAPEARAAIQRLKRVLRTP